MNMWRSDIYKCDDKINKIAVEFQEKLNPILTILIDDLNKNNCGLDTFYAIAHNGLSEEIVNVILEEQLKKLKK